MTMFRSVQFMVQYGPPIGGPIVRSFYLRKRTVLYISLRLSSILTLHHLIGHATFTRQPIVLLSNVSAINKFRSKPGTLE
jgi:hypothetical protein